jgi:hypothetical protein
VNLNRFVGNAPTTRRDPDGLKQQYNDRQTDNIGRPIKIDSGDIEGVAVLDADQTRGVTGSGFPAQPVPTIDPDVFRPEYVGVWLSLRDKKAGQPCCAEGKVGDRVWVAATKTVSEGGHRADLHNKWPKTWVADGPVSPTDRDGLVKGLSYVDYAGEIRIWGDNLPWWLIGDTRNYWRTQDFYVAIVCLARTGITTFGIVGEPLSVFPYRISLSVTPNSADVTWFGYTPVGGAPDFKKLYK